MSVPFAYLGVVLIWSTTPLAIKWSGEGVGFLFGVSARMGLALLLCLVLLRLLGQRLPLHRDARRTYLAAGLGIYGAMLCVYWGAQLIPSGLVSVLFGLNPLVTGVLAAIWLGERFFSPLRIGGALLAIAGLGVIFDAGDALAGGSGPGIAALLLAVSIHSASAVAVKRLGVSLAPLATNCGALLVAVPLYLLTWLVFGPALPAAIPMRSAAAIVYLAVLGTTVGFVLYFYILKHLSAGVISLITLITPVLALLLGQWLNGERVALAVWGGAVAIALGLLLYQWGPALLLRLRQGRRTSRTG